ncbi:pirin family protein [Aestuariicella hydrocarbonica]|uniref:Pirin family protein n=1 Tax=Pseudomaricurvus hydrocarbonicus TaxID=1470433 RepID=A0A9E5T2I3_9GAMM|nr:pirin family protein [Aestuariicella hydrocarbonica]NHO68460.1 pirin family protein [Aestuariicella hydrocarbonica]
MNRKILALHTAQPSIDGDGVSIQRIAGQGHYSQFDPFLMLDEFRGGEDGKQTKGFPEHPHRGFETVTYMLDGVIEHRDHLGNVGRLVTGGVQWMTAGRGVLHSELPIADDSHFHGFQIWVNLPASEKMTAPKYREFGPEEIPVLELDNGNTIKVIAGELSLDDDLSVANRSATGPVKEVAIRPDYWDVNLNEKTSIRLPLSPDKRVLVYVYQGNIRIAQTESGIDVHPQQMAILDKGEALTISATEQSRFLVLAAHPIGEPVVSWGPFVMNTREEIEQAIRDYQAGTLV